MKVPKVILLAHEHLYGGGTKQTFLLAQALVNAGVQTVLISNAEKTWLGQEIKNSGLPVVTYYSHRIERSIRPWQELLVLFYIIRVFLKEKPDVVLASGVKLIGLCGVAAWICNVPKRFAIIRGEGAPPGSRTLKAIYCLHRLVSLLGTRYITVSEYIRQQMISHGICRPERIHTIHDGIVVADFRRSRADKQSTSFEWLKSTSFLPEKAFKIGMIGRFVAGKRYDHFIQLMTVVCREFPHVYGLLIGEGPDRPQLERMIQATGYADRILLAGYCAEMSNVYHSLDFTVLLTDYEGCPNAVLESMAAGVPVLASNICGIPEILTSGQDGFLVLPGDIEEAAGLIRKAIESPELCRLVSQKALQTVSTRFEAAHQLETLVSYLLKSEFP